jgi:phosphatidate cytidylyltransferase
VTAPGPSGGTPPRPSPSWADLGPRFVSAIVLIAVIATGLHLGGWFWAVLAAGVFAITYREWEQMVTLKPIAPLGWGLCALLAIAALAYPAAALIHPAYGPLGTLGVAAVAVVVALFGARTAVPWRVGGLIFFAVVLIAVQELRGTVPAGIVAGWYLGIVIALNDTGAYFVGRVVGGPKLAPLISPAKTISGAIGGWLIGTIAGTIYWVVFTPSPWWLGLLFSAILGIAGQSGDLIESAIKRLFRIKDSGDIIPGHGGFMDRLDSVTFGLILLVVIGALHAGMGNVPTGFLYW